MKGRVWTTLCAGILWSAMATPAAGQVSAEQEMVETGRLLATLLDAGRVTIGQYQALINDPQKGHKGFTPAFFEEQLAQRYRQRTGIDLRALDRAAVPEIAKPLLARLIEESKKTVASYQTVINLPGIAYKGLIPATFGTETAQRFQSWSQVYLKQTAPDHFLRNPNNKADAFEVEAMRHISGPRDDGHHAIFAQSVSEEQSVRVLLPLYYDQGCLSCHGGPKGERDISGYQKEGGREGELAGAISVKLPMR